MAQASRRSSSSGPCPRRTSSLASEWAAKRQAKIEAAQARKLARENGEVTEQHTFRPNTGRGPPSMSRVPVNTVPVNTARRVMRTSSSGSTASVRRMGVETSTPLPVPAEDRGSQLPIGYSQSFGSDARLAGTSIAQPLQVDTMFAQKGARSCIHERIAVAGREQTRKRSGHEHSAKAASQCGDDPWLLSQGTCSDTSSTTATGFHVMLASSGTLSIASSHSVQGSSCSALDHQIGLLASSSQHFPILDSSDGEESEDTILDYNQLHGDSLLKQCSSGSLTGESLFLNSNAASSNVRTETKPLASNDSSLAAAVAAAVSAFGKESAQRDDIRQELRNPSWRRSSGSLERREPSFECVIATKESLIQDQASETESLELNACGDDNSSPRKASGFSWDGIATEVEDHVLSGNGRSGSSRSPFRLKGSALGDEVEKETHLSSENKKSFLRRQECVIDGMGIGRTLANSRGCITLESMKAALVDTSHDSFFHWFSNLHLAPGVVEVSLFDFAAALKEFYLQEHSEPRFDAGSISFDGGHSLDKEPTEETQARAVPAPIGYERISPIGYQRISPEESDENPDVGRSVSSGSSISEAMINSGVQPLPSMAPAKREGNVVLCPWRETPLRREEVLHRDTEWSPAVSSAMAASFLAEVQESGSQIEFVDEDAKRKWRSERVESLERKCQELEQELGVARRAQVFLQSELLTSHPRASEDNGESRRHVAHKCETTAQKRLADDLAVIERSSSPVEYSMLQYEQIVPPQALACSSSVGSDHSRFSSTRFGDWSGASTEEAGTTAGDKPSSQLLVRTLPGTGKRLLLSPVAEDPYREETAASSDEDGGDVSSQSGRPKRHEDASAEMQSMSEVWERVLSLGKSMPDVEEPQAERDAGEIKSLNALLGRLSALMEKRPPPQENARRCREQVAQDTDCSPELGGSASSWLPRSSSLPKSLPEPKTMRAAVPKLFGAPFNNCPQFREEQTLTSQDRLPSPCDAPLISPRDVRMPSPRERSAQSSPRDVRMARNVPMYSPRDAPLPSPRDLPPDSPRDVRQPPRSRPPPSPREVPLLCTSILPQLR